MLLRSEDGGVLAIGQLSHSWLSGQLAREWGNERFYGPEPFEDVVLGATQHDIGWALFDLEPGLNEETGLPRGFLEATVEDQLAIWTGAADRLVSQSLGAALVVSMHGCALSQLRASVAQEHEARMLQEHVAHEQARQDLLREHLGISEAQAERTRRQMWTWDGLSLALCLGWRPFTAKDVPAREGRIDVELREQGEGGEHGEGGEQGGGRLVLDPWPFATAEVRVHCEGRRLDGGFADRQELREALAGARPVKLEFLLEAP